MNNKMLNIPSGLNTVQERLGYWHWRLKKHLDRYNADLIGTYPEDWVNEKMGIQLELKKVENEIMSSRVGHGPPDWVVDKLQHWKNNQVVWTLSINEAAPVVRLNFLLQLNASMSFDEAQEAEDLMLKKAQAIEEIENDSRWGEF
jgi:hypothetical protein